MKTIYDIYEGVLDIDGTLEQGDSFNDLYNDAVEKIPTIDDFVRVKTWTVFIFTDLGQ